MSRLTELLPLPDENAQAHSRNLSVFLREIIAEQGPIPFSRFMRESLYAPGLGYYSAGARKFGTDGDFITAPEISPLFAQCLATQAAQVLKLTGGDLLELGAGSGSLAVDLLLSLQQQQILPEQYFILEPSADLRQRQEEVVYLRVPKLAHRVVWLDTLPESFTGLILANEVMDAFPVERFSIECGEVRQVYVTVDNNMFSWQLQNPLPALAEAVREIENDLRIRFADGYTSEINLPLRPWIKTLAQCLDTGGILLCDYGYPRREYYLPERRSGTLRCHYRHHAHEDPFFWPGLQDITCHVDFTAVVASAVEAGLELQGFTNQAQFLLASGLLQHAEAVKAETLAESCNLSQQIKQLTMPGAMGDSFSLLGLSKHFDDVFLGFRNQDQSYRL